MLSIERLLTAPSCDASALAPCLSAHDVTEKQLAHHAFSARRCVTRFGRTKITTPDDWSLSASSLFAECLCQSIPAKRQAIEENTMPSWLWAKRAEKTGATEKETHANQVFDRVTGSACHKGWKQGLWEDEVTASAFRDEVHHLLLTRMIALDQDAMKTIGLDWAYGLNALTQNTTAHTATQPSETPLGHATIDAILSHPHSQEHNFFQKLLHDSLTQETLAVRFSDTEKEWNPVKNVAVDGNPTTDGAAKGVINLAAFVDDCGDLDVFKLRHAVRLLTILMDLHYPTLAARPVASRDLMIGFHNMAALLMRLGLSYDSRTGRTTAAAVTAIITAEATATSAELAALLGKAEPYLDARDHALRCLRNMRRAAYDEETDYEHLSIVPQRLDIESGVHLVLIATARRRWDEAYEAAQKHGLRHMRTTGCFDSPQLAGFLEALSQGVNPIDSYVLDHAMSADEEGSDHTLILHPLVVQTLQSLQMDAADIRAARAHAVGHKTLRAAPALSLADLEALGFDADTLERIEKALPFARSLRTVFTPWTLGVEFCQSVLGLDEAAIEDPFFDILAHLGFSQDQIRQAEAFCFGHKTVVGLAEMPSIAASVFASSDMMSATAQIKMAAGVQSFLTHDLHLHLALSTTEAATPQDRSQAVLTGWQYGLRSLALEFPRRAVTVAPLALSASQQARKGLLAKTKAPTAPAPHDPALVKKSVAGVSSPAVASPKKQTASVKTSFFAAAQKTAPRTRVR